jgi:hypothetical protein
LLFEDGEPLTFGDFMRGILTLRGSNQTTVKEGGVRSQRRFHLELIEPNERIPFGKLT